MCLSRYFAVSLLTIAAQALCLAQYPLRGGSNYYFYRSVPYGHGNGYGIITDYFLPGVASIVTTQIEEMAGHGQRTISIPLFFAANGGSDNGTCPTSGTPGKGGVIDASTGALPLSCLDALNAVIRTCFTYGLSVRLRFFPAGANNPASWKQFDRTLALENWRFIRSVHDAMTYEHIPVDKYDLGNEGISSGNKTALTYSAYIWRQYTAAYGANDTVGFSLVCDKDCTANFAAFPAVYGPAGNFPPVFDLHIYGQCGDRSLPTAHDEYAAAANYTATKGWTQGWIIGETCYDDGETADLLAAAHSEIPSQVLFYIQQWPYYFRKVIDVPYEYSAYLRQGF